MTDYFCLRTQKKAKIFWTKNFLSFFLIFYLRTLARANATCRRKKEKKFACHLESWVIFARNLARKTRQTPKSLNTYFPLRCAVVCRKKNKKPKKKGKTTKKITPDEDVTTRRHTTARRLSRALRTPRTRNIKWLWLIAKRRLPTVRYKKNGKFAESGSSPALVRNFEQRANVERRRWWRHLQDHFDFVLLFAVLRMKDTKKNWSLNWSF